jgi:glutaconate CoA-transferase subunit B
MYSVTKNIILFREEHSRRVLVPKVEFVSARGEPRALLTGKALFSWQKDRRRFRLESVHERFDVRAQTGFEFDAPDEVPLTAPPTEEEISLLRTKVARQLAADYPDFTNRVWGIN